MIIYNIYDNRDLSYKSSNSVKTEFSRIKDSLLEIKLLSEKTDS